MRKSPLFWLALAAVCGAALFHTSQQVTDGRQKLAVVGQGILKEQETLRVLQAEWSYLNQPDRLEKLSRQYLPLEALKGRQFTRLEDIGREEKEELKETPAPLAQNQKAPAPSQKTVLKPPLLKTTVIPLRVPQGAPAAPRQADSRGFGDVMKSLGVR